MKYFLSVVIITLSFFPTESIGDDSSILDYLPAILAASKSGPLSCSNIAGCYYGTESSSGMSGKVKITLKEGCSFSGVTQNLVKFSGTISKREGSILTGTGTLVGETTVGVSINCSVQSGVMSCSYSGGGVTGNISNARKGTCIADNRFLTESIAGNWVFSFAIISTFTDYYNLYKSSVVELQSQPGTFVISGESQYNSPVSAGYDPTMGFYNLYNPGSTIDKQFIFNFTNMNQVSGCYYQYSHSSKSWSDCYYMYGIRY